ncbi:MAG: hypothetical protein OM95_15575 [Bdellovibrio sp. ArHS]|uniref:hypothetical protein n=1 Tax=Bdellovibrio sp. ArHS TaxID=1569284 RepID=UPI000582A5F3|nr:hypothetical protein [Bdellovibrio sp. ArHS]KHD87202.1 MAG: hypothetical protein OM95_15575 [Bdellovibrio sp. ArHS]
MSDDSLKKFLKANASRTPEADFAEGPRIWRHIQAGGARRWQWLLVPVLAASLVAVIFLKYEKPATYLNDEELYLQQEWAEMQSEVDAEVDQEFVTVFEK